MPKRLKSSSTEDKGNGKDEANAQPVAQPKAKRTRTKKNVVADSDYDEDAQPAAQPRAKRTRKTGDECGHGQ